jgi:hypothetical protein
MGFRPDELVEQSLSKFISPEETREFTAALREVVEKGVTRNARLNPRSASGEVISTTLNASALEILTRLRGFSRSIPRSWEVLICSPGDGLLDRAVVPQLGATTWATTRRGRF